MKFIFQRSRLSKAIYWTLPACAFCSLSTMCYPRTAEYDKEHRSHARWCTTLWHHRTFGFKNIVWYSRVSVVSKYTVIILVRTATHVDCTRYRQTVHTENNVTCALIPLKMHLYRNTQFRRLRWRFKNIIFDMKHGRFPERKINVSFLTSVQMNFCFDKKWKNIFSNRKISISHSRTDNSRQNKPN